MNDVLAKYSCDNVLENKDEHDTVQNVEDDSHKSRFIRKLCIIECVPNDFYQLNNTVNKGIHTIDLNAKHDMSLEHEPYLKNHENDHEP